MKRRIILLSFILIYASSVAQDLRDNAIYSCLNFVSCMNHENFEDAACFILTDSILYNTNGLTPNEIAKMTEFEKKETWISMSYIGKRIRENKKHRLNNNDDYVFYELSSFQTIRQTCENGLCIIWFDDVLCFRIYQKENVWRISFYEKIEK